MPANSNNDEIAPRPEISSRSMLIRFWLNIFASGAVIAYLCLSHIPGHYDKDWVHLWTAGKMVTSGHGSDLYNLELHHQILKSTYQEEIPPAMWGGRYQMYGVFYYPPPMALYYAGFGWLPRYPASVAHAIISVLLAGWCAWLINRITDSRMPRSAALLAILLYPPFFYNYSLGQNAMLTLAIILTAWWLIDGDREILAGMVLGLFICKINWLAALGWIPLIHGRWRILLGMGAGAAGVVLFSIFALGYQPFADYFELFPKVAKMHEAPGYVLKLKYSSLGLFRKWLGVGPTSDMCGWALAALTGLVTWIVTWRRWRPGKPEFRLMMICCLTAAMWINPHLNYYDLMLTVVAVSVIIADWDQLAGRFRYLAVALIAFNYAACPWDNNWTLSQYLPVPCFALLATWGWFVWHLIRLRQIRTPTLQPEV